jgi:hypothetical protein
VGETFFWNRFASLYLDESGEKAKAKMLKIEN